MIDIHSHFLYGLDDGPADRDTSISMLRMAFDDGTTDIVATPHSDLKYSFQPDAIAAQLHDFSSLSGIPNLHAGCDFHLSFDNIQDCSANPSKYTINALNYLLVEFGNVLIPPTIGDVFTRMRENGLVPVITHPERNPILAKDLPRVAHWVETGLRVQITAQSLLGRFGRLAERVSREMIGRGLVHFVASDGHNLKNRPPTLRIAYEKVKVEYGDLVAERLFVLNPAAVLTGKTFDAAVPTKPREWFKLW